MCLQLQKIYSGLELNTFNNLVGFIKQCLKKELRQENIKSKSSLDFGAQFLLEQIVANLVKRTDFIWFYYRWEIMEQLPKDLHGLTMLHKAELMDATLLKVVWNLHVITQLYSNEWYLRLILKMNNISELLQFNGVPRSFPLTIKHKLNAIFIIAAFWIINQGLERQF